MEASWTSDVRLRLSVGYAPAGFWGTLLTAELYTYCFQTCQVGQAIPRGVPEGC